MLIELYIAHENNKFKGKGIGEIYIKNNIYLLKENR
jgi:hypothetical protein